MAVEIQLRVVDDDSVIYERVVLDMDDPEEGVDTAEEWADYMRGNYIEEEQ